MDMQEFIAKIHERNFGVASFNTYMQDGVNHCFIIVTEIGNDGRFFKEECIDQKLNNTLQKMLDDIEKWHDYITGSRSYYNI